MSIVAHDAKGSPWSLVWVNPSACGIDNDIRLECRMTARELIAMGRNGTLPGRLQESLERYVGTLERTLKLVEDSKMRDGGRGRAKSVSGSEPAPLPPTDADADPLIKNRDRAY